MTDKKRKYLFLTSTGSHFPELLAEGIQRPGSYQIYRMMRWGNWEADVKHIDEISKEELLSADLIQWNFAGCNIKYIRETKSMLINANKTTPLILNGDYPFEDTEAGMGDPLEFLKAFFCVDLIYATEPSQLGFFQYLVDHIDPPVGQNRFRGKSVPHLPHPVDTEMKKWKIPVDERLNLLSICHRRYGGGQFFMPAWMTEKMFKRFEGGTVEPVLTMIHGLVNPIAPTFMYDYVGGRGPGNWEKYITMLQWSKWAFSYPMHYTHDRFAAECATLGVPLVTNTYSYFGQLMFPELCHHPLDFEGMRQSLQRLIDDDDFYHKCVDYACDAVEQFNYENCYKRYIGALNAWGIPIEP